VLQSVYVSVLSGRARYEGRSSFRTWLFAVIRNTARSRLRRRWWSRVVRLDFESLNRLGTMLEDSPEGALGQADGAAPRLAALSRLPQRKREVVHLVFYEDLTVGQAAAVMSVSVGAARQHYARAKAALRILLKNLDAAMGAR